MQQHNQQHEHLQNNHLTQLQPTMNNDIDRSRNGVEHQRITPHLKEPVNLTKQPTPLTLPNPQSLQQTNQQNKLVKRKQPQHGRPKPIMHQLITNGNNKLTKRRLIPNLTNHNHNIQHQFDITHNENLQRKNGMHHHQLHNT
ncbi:MAG: hypothetical protein O7C59_07270 [Rickettsia endosymbiont of Ixodes persulcatus]|nr:hypothetical protein [Rickettsia endosymbiont of Ixodes persulcatus]